MSHLTHKPFSQCMPGKVPTRTMLSSASLPASSGRVFVYSSMMPPCGSSSQHSPALANARHVGHRARSCLRGHCAGHYSTMLITIPCYHKRHFTCTSCKNRMSWMAFRSVHIWNSTPTHSLKKKKKKSVQFKLVFITVAASCLPLAEMACLSQMWTGLSFYEEKKWSLNFIQMTKLLFFLFFCFFFKQNVRMLQLEFSLLAVNKAAWRLSIPKINNKLHWAIYKREYMQKCKCESGKGQSWESVTGRAHKMAQKDYNKQHTTRNVIF